MKSKIILITTAALAVIMFFSIPSYAGDKAAEETPLAEVDEQTITQEDLDTFFNAFFYRKEVKEQLDKMPDFRRDNVISREKGRALKKLIQRSLLVSAAENKYLQKDEMSAVIDDMTEKRMEEIKKSADSWVEFVQDLHDRDISLRQWKKLLRESILIQNYLHEETRDDIRIRPVEVRRYYDKNRKQYAQPKTIYYRLIVVAPELVDESEPPEEVAQSIHQKLSDGESFEQVAESYSLTQSEGNGELKEVEVPADKPDWRPPVLQGLEPGEISQVQKVESGYAIARLERIEPAGTKPYDEVQNQIQDRLRKKRQQEVQERLVERLEEEANIEILPAGRRIMGDR